MNSRTVAALGMAFANAVPKKAPAQWSLGAHGGYDVDAEEFVLGMSVDFQITGAAIQGTSLQFSPGFEFYPGIDAGTYWVVDLDVEYPFPARGVAPYAGAGLWISHFSVDVGAFGVSDTNVGLNLKGGAKFGSSPTVRPFAEGVLRVGDGSTLVIRGGLSFQFGT